MLSRAISSDASPCTFTSRVLWLLPFLIVVLAGCDRGPEVVFTDAGSSQFAAGQIWLYRTRPEDENSFLIITEVDGVDRDGELSNVIHVFVDGLTIEHPRGGQLTQIRHLPMTEEALSMSVIADAGIAEVLPDNRSAVETWRKSFLQGDAEVVNVSVAEAIAAVVASLEP